MKSLAKNTNDVSNLNPKEKFQSYQSNPSIVYMQYSLQQKHALDILGHGSKPKSPIVIS